MQPRPNFQLFYKMSIIAKYSDIVFYFFPELASSGTTLMFFPDTLYMSFAGCDDNDAV